MNQKNKLKNIWGKAKRARNSMDVVRMEQVLEEAKQYIDMKDICTYCNHYVGSSCTLETRKVDRVTMLQYNCLASLMAYIEKEVGGGCN